jgi:hypothetical protein
MWLQLPNAAQKPLDNIELSNTAVLLLDGIAAANLDLVESARAAWPPATLNAHARRTRTRAI